MRTISQIMFVFVILLLSAVLSKQVAEAAATYYVATTGNDTTGNGSIGNPWLTIPKGIRSLRAGDTLYIRAGTYTLSSTYGNSASDTYGCQAGCPTSWATATRISNYPGEAVTINSHGFVMKSTSSAGGVGYLIWQGDSRANFVHQSNVSAGEGNDTGFLISEAVHHIRISTLTVRNFNSHGITAGGPGIPKFIEILNNEIKHNGDNVGRGESHEHGLYPNSGQDWLIAQNNFVGNWAYGIHIHCAETLCNRFTVTGNRVEGRSGLSGTTAGIVISGGTGHVVKNNIVIGKGTQQTQLTVGIQASSTAVGAEIYNNTIYGVITGIQLSGASGQIVRNNLINTVTTSIEDFGANTISNNLCPAVLSGCRVVTNTPGFVTPGSNFRLAAGSLAIDAGASISTVTNDYDGVDRPVGDAYDIGAYEGSTGPDDQAPIAPVGLRIN